MKPPDKKYLVVDLVALNVYGNLGATGRDSTGSDLWISTTLSGPEREALASNLKDVEGFQSGLVSDISQRLDDPDAKVDPLVRAGWRALLFIAFGAVLVLSCLGFLVHAYTSFRSRQLEFALIRTVGFSMKQLGVTVWIEQILVIALGLLLGTWMGQRLSATIMPFLGHDDFGKEVVPPFAIEVNWGTLLVTYGIMLFVFGLISLGMVWLIQRIQLQRILRLGEA